MQTYNLWKVYKVVNNNINYNDPIDAVIMWVDGSDQAFIDKEKEQLDLERKKGKKIVHSAARHRDNGELRYLLRSIHANLGWVRNIFIVTNGQVPPYVDFSKGNIRLVSHSEIFSNSENVPTFNTFSIESCINNIEGLSDQYIRFSDDFFVGRNISKEEYLDEYSKYIFKGEVQDSPIGAYQAQVKHNSEIMCGKLGVKPRFNFAHAPQLRSRKIFSEYERVFSDELEFTRTNKFRDKFDIISLFLYPYFMVYRNSPKSIERMSKGYKDDFVYVQDISFSARYAQVLLGKAGVAWESQLKRIESKRPVYFNLNDSYGAADEGDVVDKMTAFLEEMFPEVSPWEAPCDS